ncbi:hypothetical protein MNBD_ALPHA01-427 [hydrothermal vent metagenome]|uniref:TraB/GumN family protein n=1 Tax=hydrothermal vent metagenome TaxID=652676 RepID=A0A3B0S6Y3_9ZZZZ
MILNAIGSLNRRLFLRTFGIFMIGILAVSWPVRAEDAEIVNAKPAMWLVEKDQGKTYFLGSFHLLPKNYNWYNGLVQSSFTSADELVLEIDLSNEATAEIQAMFIQNGFFTDEDNLKNHLDAARYEKMLTYARKYMGQEEAAAQKMKPWFMAVNLSVLAIMSSGMDPDSGVDKYLAGQAQIAQKPISGLETPMAQMMALIDHPLDVQAAMLSETLDQLDDFKAVMNGYLDAWASGDGDRIASTMINDMRKYQGMYEALLVKRNKNWVAGLEGHINSGKTVFVVVGAAHLVGPDSVLIILQDKGYNVVKIQ